MCCLNTFDGPCSLGASGARVFLLIFIHLIFLHYLELKLKEGVGRREAVGKGDSMNNRACFSCNHCIQPDIKFYILCQQSIMIISGEIVPPANESSILPE